ncbi:winged helix-turn-helix transcriptional regulator [Defluviimonas salinarum]|uniref:Helix-turn-helix transcriptional regulator n=1 Tax=Defluviimonas salinarum TaxID=2992147 RepID=A0ABT3J861_9RHOB|nr:helix-turn-helix domain-containing protein [Defluviimonas salinarum]MCW3783840.1 helix-turn-helix transcriptional regulator [Defluviimonas salinarum]
MAEKSYSLFCPLAMACEIIEPRWTLLILAEMWDGSTRFNEIRRGVPGISPTLLSRRLKEMEANGLVERIEDRAKATVDYVRTPLATELEDAMTCLGDWAYRNIRASVVLGEPNPDYLMWQLRRTIDPVQLPRRRIVIRFHFTDLTEEVASYWMVAKPGVDVDLCMSDPGFEVDLFIEAEVKALTSAWMGYSALETEIANDRIYVSGDPILIRSVDRWLGLCPYAEAG